MQKQVYSLYNNTAVLRQCLVVQHFFFSSLIEYNGLHRGLNCAVCFWLNLSQFVKDSQISLQPRADES